MVFVAKGLKAIRAMPDDGADRLTRVGPGEKLFATGKSFPDLPTDGDPLWVEIFLPDDKTTGWILSGEFQEEPDPAPRPLDEEFFVRSSLTVERQINSESATAPWFVAADFLIARAIFETGLSSGSMDLDQGIGPLAVTKSEFDQFISATELEIAKSFAVSDRRQLMAQIYAAGYDMTATARAFSQKSTAISKPTDDINVPSYLDLFVAYLIDIDTAVAFADQSLDRSRTLAEFGLADGTLTALAGRTGLANTKGSTTISAFLKNVSEALARLLDSAFDRMKTLAPDELPKSEGQIPAWLTIARTELARPVSEAVNSERILTYFDTIGFGKIGGTVPHWCGAFVGFCVKTAGAPLPSEPARAANWKTWGNRNLPLGASQIPTGAIVVLKPQAPTTSGHVAFFETFVEERKVELLGGNQNDEVSKAPFAVTEISAIRMQAESLPIGAGDVFDMTRAGVAAGFQKYGDLIIDRFTRAGFNTKHQLAAALANAIRESSLDPRAASKPPERSFGLFQCNQKAGLGKGYSIEQLMDPDLNIGLIIAEARRSRSFVSASTLKEAVTAFVKYVERPKDTAGEITKRLEIANELLGLG